eukprot:scaffold11460_cov64-Phaeocystis_antarctica.AAC.6
MRLRHCRRRLGVGDARRRGGREPSGVRVDALQEHPPLPALTPAAPRQVRRDQRPRALVRVAIADRKEWHECLQPRVAACRALPRKRRPYRGTGLLPPVLEPDIGRLLQSRRGRVDAHAAPRRFPRRLRPPVSCLGPAVFVVDAHFLPGLNRLTSHDQHAADALLRQRWHAL